MKVQHLSNQELDWAYDLGNAEGFTEGMRRAAEIAREQQLNIYAQMAIDASSVILKEIGE